MNKWHIILFCVIDRRPWTTYRVNKCFAIEQWCCTMLSLLFSCHNQILRPNLTSQNLKIIHFHVIKHIPYALNNNNQKNRIQKIKCIKNQIRKLIAVILRSDNIRWTMNFASIWIYCDSWRHYETAAILPTEFFCRCGVRALRNSPSKHWTRI